MLPDWLDPQVFLSDPALGPWVVLTVCAIVFAETGLLVGFFLPGDSLLFTAGLLVATGTVQINVWALGLLISLAAFVGDQLGYWIGRKAGPAVFSRPDSRIFRQENVRRAEQFFARHGGKAVILARFVGVVRTFTPVVAGIGRMPYRVYLGFDAIGALLWGLGVTLLGYVLGNRVPFVRDHLDLLVVGVVLLTMVTVGLGLLRQRNKATSSQPGSAQPNVDAAGIVTKEQREDAAPEAVEDAGAAAEASAAAEAAAGTPADAEPDNASGPEAPDDSDDDASAPHRSVADASTAESAPRRSSGRRAADRPAAARQPERRLSPPRRPPLPQVAPLPPLKKPAPEPGDGLL